ncbi:MAG: PSD1 and planctomycete cytochrome C domain-containing protein, partial [Planctomycetes bacterium]|nr:PSD1 and planctomycete cytochrome C domain-containing protein [Planctomycetota bacterium]
MAHRVSLAVVFAGLLLLHPHAYGADKVVFDRDVRPLLAEKCFACHGPDVKDAKGDLRLDRRDSVVHKDGSGAIVPGKPDESELIRRILASDGGERMPPPDSHKELSAAEKDVLRRWVAEGAEYADHWAFTAARKPALPSSKNKAWVRNPIDAFVLAGLEQRGMEPSAEADRETLVRRVSLDLRGLPPTLAEIDAYLNDQTPGAYERMVERMLASPHYGEKMALIWMDLARYGDTSGYHLDSTRDTWPWRDWVINAYNNNMPFDRFTIEQLGGDLLPNATEQQKIASGFNRNARFNEEGGADPDEWLVRYAVDRTVTLGRVWLGLTLNCAECHSHKYDPISHKEFYELYAFFNSMQEVGAGGMAGFHNKPVPPVMRVSLSSDQKLKAEIAEVELQADALRSQLVYHDPGSQVQRTPVDEIWIDDDLPPGVRPYGDSPWKFITASEGPVFKGKRASVREAKGLSQHFINEAEKPLVVGQGDLLISYVYFDPANLPKQIMLQWNDGGGEWEHRAYWGVNHTPWGVEGTPSRVRMGPLPKAGEWVRLEVKAEDVGFKPGSVIRGWAFSQFGGKVYWDAAGLRRGSSAAQYSLAAWRAEGAKSSSLPAHIRKLLEQPADKLTAEQEQQIRNYYLQFVCFDTRETFAKVNARLDQLQSQLRGESGPAALQPISVEMDKPRPAFLLLRGDFQQPGERVERNVPAILPQLPAEGPRNRLSLARWLFDPQHPLTARVTVNRLWAQVFGRGIVETVGDFGRLGRYPSHPELLDWMAVEFRESGWDTKHMFRLILNSATYRQAALNQHRYDEQDPANILLSRSPRYRLMAEEIRDSALRTSGLLSETIGGVPVYPFQPVNYYTGKQGGWKWNLSAGENRYRRGMYTFWRRTTPYPTFVIFDAPDRS